MEALTLVSPPEHAPTSMATHQRRRSPQSMIEDFDDFWRPMFRRLDAERGFQVEALTSQNARTKLSVQTGQGVPPATTADITEPYLRTATWALDYEVTQQKPARFTVRGSAKGVEFPPFALADWTWIHAGPQLTALDIRLFSRLKHQGKDGFVTELLNQVDEQISGVELLAPTGHNAMVFIRLGDGGLLPLQMMGEGVQRCFEMAVTLAAVASPPLFIDEIENGLHHSILEPTWRWIANTSAKRGIQLFATTHSEECVMAACRAFSAQNDDGLRVIRLDRQKNETKAVIYDRNLVEAAERMGVEIRG